MAALHISNGWAVAKDPSSPISFCSPSSFCLCFTPYVCTSLFFPILPLRNPFEVFPFSVLPFSPLYFPSMYFFSLLHFLIPYIHFLMYILPIFLSRNFSPKSILGPSFPPVLPCKINFIINVFSFIVTVLHLLLLLRVVLLFNWHNYIFYIFVIQFFSLEFYFRDHLVFCG